MTAALTFTVATIGHLVLAGATARNLSFKGACTHLLTFASLSGLAAGAWYVVLDI